MEMGDASQCGGDVVKEGEERRESLDCERTTIGMGVRGRDIHLQPYLPTYLEVYTTGMAWHEYGELVIPTRPTNEPAYRIISFVLFNFQLCMYI